MPWSNDIPGRSEKYRSGNGYKSITNLQEIMWESSSPNGENMEQWYICPGVAGVKKLLQEHIENSFEKSQKTPDEHPRTYRPLKTEFMPLFLIPLSEQHWA